MANIWFRVTYPEVKMFPNGWYGSPAGSPKIQPVLIDEIERLQIGYTLDEKPLWEEMIEMTETDALEMIENYLEGDLIYTGERLFSREDKYISEE
jgi:hypothetical protein